MKKIYRKYDLTVPKEKPLLYSILYFLPYRYY